MLIVINFRKKCVIFIIIIIIYWLIDCLTTLIKTIYNSIPHLGKNKGRTLNYVYVHFLHP